jgi:hypothetical protein
MGWTGDDEMRLVVSFLGAMDNSTDSAQLKEEYERRAKLFGGYTAFVAALLVATIVKVADAKGADYPHAYVVIGLLAVSLPSLVAMDFLDFIVRVRQQREKSMYRGLATGLGFGPSLLGIAGLIGHFSVIAGVLFGILVVFWCIVIDVVVFRGYEPKADI